MAPTDLEQIERMLADERPDLDDAAAARIDERVRRVRERRRLPRLGLPTMRQLSAAGAAATLLVGLVVGVSQVGDDEPAVDGDAPRGAAATSTQPTVGEAAPPAAEPSEVLRDSSGQAEAEIAGKAGAVRKSNEELNALGGGAVAGDVGRASLPPAPGGGLAAGQKDRVVERNASITISGDPDEVRKMADEVVEITDRLGGIVISASVDERPNQPRQSSANLEIAIPVAKLEQALADISKVGSVEARTQTDLDVTSEAVSANNRLRNARDTRNALRARLAEATDPDEIEQLRRQIERAERRVAARKADVQRLANRTQFARVFVGVVGKGHGSGDDGDWTLDDAWNDAVDVLRTMAGVALITTAIVLPLALILTLSAWLITRTRRRARESALDED